MNGQVFLVVVLLGLGAANAGLFGHFIDHVKHEVEKHGNDLGKDLNKLTDVKQLLGIGGKRLTSVTAVGMSWSSCGGAADIIKINSMSLGPDPLHLPGTVQASFDITAGRNVTNPISVDLEVSVKKDPFGWIKIPCIDHKGSCKYDDVCPHTAQKDCPDVFIKNNIPCNCPFKEGHYVLPESNIDIDKVSIPSFLKNGEFKARARVTMGGQELVCVNVEFKLK